MSIRKKPIPCDFFVQGPRNLCQVCRLSSGEHLIMPQEKRSNFVYDVRAEYLPRNNFRAIYGRPIPVVFGDDSDNYDRAILKNSKVINPSETSAFVEYKKENNSTPSGSETTVSSESGMSDVKVHRQRSVSFSDHEQIVEYDGCFTIQKEENTPELEIRPIPLPPPPPPPPVSSPGPKINGEVKLPKSKQNSGVQYPIKKFPSLENIRSMFNSEYKKPLRPAGLAKSQSVCFNSTRIQETPENTTIITIGADDSIPTKPVESPSLPKFSPSPPTVPIIYKSPLSSPEIEPSICSLSVGGSTPSTSPGLSEISSNLSRSYHTDRSRTFENSSPPRITNFKATIMQTIKDRRRKSSSSETEKHKIVDFRSGQKAASTHEKLPERMNQKIKQLNGVPNNQLSGMKSIPSTRISNHTSKRTLTSDSQRTGVSTPVTALSQMNGKVTPLSPISHSSDNVSPGTGMSSPASQFTGMSTPAGHLTGMSTPASQLTGMLTPATKPIRTSTPVMQVTGVSTPVTQLTSGSEKFSPTSTDSERKVVLYSKTKSRHEPLVPITALPPHSVDIHICQHVPMFGFKPATALFSSSQERPGEKIGSIRRLVRRLENSFGGDKKTKQDKRSLSLGRFSRQFTPRPSLFHSIDDQCTATHILAANNEVAVTEVAEAVAVPKPIRETQLGPGSRSMSDVSKDAVKSTPVRRSISKESTPRKSRENTPKTQKEVTPRRVTKGTTPNKLKENTPRLTKEHSNSDTKLVQDRYLQMANSHVTTLAYLSEHFHEISIDGDHVNISNDVLKSLKWQDFELDVNSPLLVKNNDVAFYSAAVQAEKSMDKTGPARITLMISPPSYQCHPLLENESRPFYLPVLCHFEDQVPCELCVGCGGNISRVSVLPNYHPISIESYGKKTANRHHPLYQPTLHEREVCFIMIQLLTALKHLQSRGFEEVTTSLDEFVLMLSDNRTPRLSILPDALLSEDNKSTFSLCSCALRVLCILLHTENSTVFRTVSAFTESFQKLAAVLAQEKANSLTNAQVLMEITYWLSFPEPFNVSKNVPSTKFNEDLSAKMWLDIERAKTVNRIVRILVENDKKSLDLVERYRIDFLLHVTVKQLCELSQ